MQLLGRKNVASAHVTLSFCFSLSGSVSLSDDSGF